jgi:hypothetical protein
LESNIEPFDIIYSALDKQLQVPDRFQSVEQAMLCLQQLTSRFLKLFQRTEAYHTDNDHAWVPGQVATPLQSEHLAICAEFSVWEIAVSHSFAVGSHPTAYLLLEAQAHVFQINQHVYLHGESSYDDLIHRSGVILDLIDAYLSSCSRIPTFTSSPEIVPQLFEIATRTKDEHLRERATQMLRECNRREGIWDSKMAARLVEHRHNLIKQGTLIVEEFLCGSKFFIADILLLSERRCLVRYGFKKIREGSFYSFWFETIRPEEGELHEHIIELGSVESPDSSLVR